MKIIGHVMVDKVPENCYMCRYHCTEYIKSTCILTGERDEDYTGKRRMPGCLLRKSRAKKGEK